MASSVQSGCSARNAAAFSSRAEKYSRSAARNFCAGDIAWRTFCASVFIGFTNQYKTVSLLTERGYLRSSEAGRSQSGRWLTLWRLLVLFARFQHSFGALAPDGQPLEKVKARVNFRG